MLRLVVALLILLPASANAAENCTCRSRDGKVAEGGTACIRTANGSMMARCERVLNNTSWKFLDQPCPVSQGQPPAPVISQG